MAEQQQQTSLSAPISSDISDALPQGYIVRALQKSDYDNGFLDCLRVLTTVGDIAEADFHKQYERLVATGSYHIIVVEDTTRSEKAIVGTGALIVEHKL